MNYFLDSWEEPLESLFGGVIVEESKYKRKVKANMTEHIIRKRGIRAEEEQVSS